MISSTAHHLPGRLTAPARARRLLREQLGSDPRLQDAMLALSEIVANAVRHGGPSVQREGVTVEISSAPGALRVCVRYQGPSFAVPSVTAKAAAVTGLGIVDRLVDRWGVEDESPTMQIWFELDEGPEQES